MISFFQRTMINFVILVQYLLIYGLTTIYSDRSLALRTYLNSKKTKTSSNLVRTLAEFVLLVFVVLKVV